MFRKFKLIATEEIEKQYSFVKDEKIRIEGEIFFGIDFSWQTGTFENLIFTVQSINSDKTNQWVSLVAPGYGANPGTDDYGNGAIFVYKKDFDKLIKV